MRRLAVFCLGIAAFAQQPPQSPCNFDGFDTSSKLSEVKAATTAYYGCAAGKKCLPMNLKPGDSVVVNRAESQWTCGYLTASRGGAPGWVRSADIQPVAFDPRPTLAAWLGTWVQAENRIRIKASKTPGSLDLDGEAYWHGAGDNVHDGEFSAEARPAGNKLHVEDGPCRIDLALAGKYILANDNNMCGGLNVRFWGVWMRAR